LRREIGEYDDLKTKIGDLTKKLEKTVFVRFFLTDSDFFFRFQLEKWRLCPEHLIELTNFTCLLVITILLKSPHSVQSNLLAVDKIVS
jgi:hypothetical protein